MSSPLLQLTNVSKSYGTGPSRTEVLHDVNLTIERGKLVGFLERQGHARHDEIPAPTGDDDPDTPLESAPLSDELITAGV